MSILSVSVTPAQTIGPEVNYSFYGHAANGWGFSNATISDPGPNVTVYLGDIVTLTLVANDTLPHNWFIDYDGDRVPSPGEPSSPDFNTATGPKVIVWNFTADRPGTWTYRCRYHPTTMTGTIIIVGESPLPPLPPPLDPVLTILLGTIAFVLLFSAGYHARAVRARRREK